MAISGNFQKALYAKSADKVDYSPRNRAQAEALQAEYRATGEYRRVEIRTFNNGSRARPLTGYFINLWRK